MTTDLISAICFENEEPTTVYHIFETKEGPNTMVKDNQVITLALHYVWELLLVTSKVPLLYNHYHFSKMTLTERNRLQYDLRQKMWQAQQTVEFCKNEIQRLNRVYQEQFEPDMYDMMFNDTPTDTPMFDEYYGG